MFISAAHRAQPKPLLLLLWCEPSTLHTRTVCSQRQLRGLRPWGWERLGPELDSMTDTHTNPKASSRPLPTAPDMVAYPVSFKHSPTLNPTQPCFTDTSAGSSFLHQSFLIWKKFMCVYVLYQLYINIIFIIYEYKIIITIKLQI